MATEENREQQRPAYTERRRDSSGGIIVIVIIAMIVFFNVNRQDSDAGSEGKSPERDFDRSAFMSGIDYRSNASAFRGGKASVVMGGVKLDLREAQIEGDEATIDISVIMGGVEIRIPRSWAVVNEVTPIMGGVEDKSRPFDATKKLIIKGSVVAGGLDIKN